MESKSVLNTKGVPIGVAYYYPGWRDTPAFCETRRFSNGTVRRVFTDSKGRALMVGWFWANAYEGVEG